MSTHGAGGSLFGTLTGWELQTAGAPESSKRSNYVSETGNELGSQLYDKRKEVRQTFKVKANYGNTPATIPALIGALLGETGSELVLLRIELAGASNSGVMMTLVGHRHLETGGGDKVGSSAPRSIAHGITLRKNFGANCFSIAPTGMVAISSSSITIECDHDETPNNDGNTVAGENYNPRITGTFSGTGITATAPAGYDGETTDPQTNNNGFKTVSINIQKALAFAE